MIKSAQSVFDVSDLVTNVLLAATSASPEKTKIICNQSDDAKPVTGSEVDLGMAMYCILLRAIQHFHAGSGKRKQIHILVICVRRANTILLEISSNSSQNTEIETPADFDADMRRAARVIQSNGGRLTKKANPSSALDRFIIELPCVA